MWLLWRELGDWIWVCRTVLRGSMCARGIAKMRSWDVTWHDSHMDATEQHARIIAQRMAAARELVGVPVDVLAARSSVEAGGARGDREGAPVSNLV